MRRLAGFALTLAAVAASGAAAAGPAAQTVRLSAIPFELPAFGALARGFAPESWVTGAQDNRKKAKETVDPGDTAATLAAAGRLTGFERTFSDPKLRALGRTGWIEARSQVGLYRSPRLAAEAAVRVTADFRRLAGKAISPTARLGAVTFFRPAGLPSGTVGIRSRFDLGRIRLYQTSIAFVRGALVAEVSLVRGDAANVDATATRLTRALAARLDTALLPPSAA